MILIASGNGIKYVGVISESQI